MMGTEKILVCEDDESILEILQLVLADSGFTTVLSNSCSGINELVARERPGLVILDLWMPDMNGDVALQQLRGQPATSDLPVIMISASHEGAAIAKGAGATAFVAKPFDINHLVETVRKCLH